METALYLIIGLVGGVFSGLFGIGGATLIIPALVWGGMALKRAQGTTLAAFLPPVAILAVLAYRKSGLVDFRAAALIAVGLLIGAYFGAILNISQSEALVRRLFGAFLFVVAIRFLVGR